MLSVDLSGEEEDVRRVYNCTSCAYYTYNKSNLNKHMKRMHRDIRKPETSTWICDTCGKVLKSKFGLELHVKNSHTKEYRYLCNVCQKGYNQRIPFRYHLASHSNVGLDKCKACRKEFNSSGSLKRHLETCPSSKNNNRPHTCPICQATFARKYRLDEHRRGKHGDGKYACSLCGKIFGWRSSLKAHSKVCKLKI